MSRKQAKENTSKMNPRRIAALIGVILLALLYLAALIAAIVDSSASGRLVWMCLFGTVAIPMLIWIYTWMYGRLTGRDTIADFERGTGGGGAAQSESKNADQT